MVFLMSLGFFITPALIGGPQQMMLAALIQQQVTELLNWPFAGALSVCCWPSCWRWCWSSIAWCGSTVS